jgi:hypothetical protein
MSAAAILEWGDQVTPFRLFGQEPIVHQAGQSRIADQLWDYAAGHRGFYGWLRTTDRHIQTVTGICLMDLPDRRWREDYDDRVPPQEAADIAIDEAAAKFGTDPP